jgi:hypothetical protein
MFEERIEKVKAAIKISFLGKILASVNFTYVSVQTTQ